MRKLEVGQIWVRRQLSKLGEGKGRIASIYRITALSPDGKTATCQMLDKYGRPQGLKVLLPDNYMTRMECLTLEQLDMPI